jgi:hypothetical protein
MKCIYYLAPTLASTQQISDDLHAVGVQDFFLHVICKNESGLKQQHIHSSNYLETLDFVRDGFIGAALGFVVGLAGIGLLQHFRPFGPDVPSIVYFALVAAATLFGAWEGGLIGIGTENKKLAKFHDDIEGGKYLMLVYCRKEKETTVREMMAARHQDAELVAIDRHFINPFSTVKRLAEAPISSAGVPQKN